VELEKWLHYAVLSIFTLIGLMRLCGWAGKRSDRVHRIRRVIARLATEMKQPYAIIALIVVLLVAMGAILVGDSSHMLGPGFSAREAGSMAFSFAAEIILFTFIIDQCCSVANVGNGRRSKIQS